MAGNARFHNKYHRRNHHTLPSAGYPDSGADPIASPQEPFLGDFHAVGALSATGNLTIGGNTLIYGNLSALGDVSVIDTFVTVTSALSVFNKGTGPALTVIQEGIQDIAVFLDDTQNALKIMDSAKIRFFEEGSSGAIGINTTDLSNALTIKGSVSASGSINALSSNVGIVVNDKTTSYTFTNDDNNRIVHFNTTTQSLCAIFPSTLRTDFNCAVMNTGTNILTLSTYTTLRAIAPNISTQYGAAFVYKDSSNNIYAVGRL